MSCHIGGMKLDHRGNKVGVIPEQFLFFQIQSLGKAVKVDHRDVVGSHHFFCRFVVDRHILFAGLVVNGKKRGRYLP